MRTLITLGIDYFGHVFFFNMNMLNMSFKRHVLIAAANCKRFKKILTKAEINLNLINFQ